METKTMKTIRVEIDLVETTYDDDENDFERRIQEVRVDGCRIELKVTGVRGPDYYCIVDWTGPEELGKNIITLEHVVE